MNSTVNDLPEPLGQLVRDYRLPDELGFGREIAPVMYRAEFRAGAWSAGELTPFGAVPVNPAATALQFAQQAFEGMKAYRVTQPEPMLFRPELNFQRLNRSAERLCMPPLTAELFADALSAVVGACQPFLPGGPGQSLYLRPTLIGTDPSFAVKGSDAFTFLLVASPSDAYYPAPIRVMVEREQSRAAPGGTGADKVGGNYAASLQATRRCTELGFDQPLWLDAAERRAVEELSGMNLMAVIGGALHTPALSGSILPGVTRDSLLHLAAADGLDVVERVMPVAELLEDLATGRCTELFACGTAAVVCPIAALGEANGTVFSPPDVDELARQLRLALLDIQEGRSNDPFGWMVRAADRNGLRERLAASP